MVNNMNSFYPFMQTARLLAALAGANGGVMGGINGGLGGINGGLGGLNPGLLGGMNGRLANVAIPGVMAGGLNPPMVAGGVAGLFRQPQLAQVSLSGCHFNYLNSARQKTLKHNIAEFNSVF